MSTRYGLVESAIDDFAKRGGFDDLPGKGKPHKIDDEDVFSSILKKNNYQPPWAELRKEIAADLKRLADNPGSDHELRAELEAVNDKIRTYNRIVPHPMLQKGLVSRANLENAYPKWV
ncbi:DUF1992 domain-containing protein [Paenibacillus sp. S28]|nr:DUF1992 domain-containing protein [Paenibacillus sp. S28]